MHGLASGRDPPRGMVRGQPAEVEEARRLVEEIRSSSRKFPEKDLCTVNQRIVVQSVFLASAMAVQAVQLILFPSVKQVLGP